MIVKNLKIFSQNIRKNSVIINTILETQNQFDILFIQEPLWSEIHKFLSSLNCNGELFIGTCYHPNWIAFARSPPNCQDFPRVITYINICISSFCFLLCNDIFNHRDINLISFSNNGICHYILNVYSDSSYLALNVIA